MEMKQGRGLQRTDEPTYVVMEWKDDRSQGLDRGRHGNFTKAFNSWMHHVKKVSGGSHKGHALEAMKYGRAKDAAEHSVLLAFQFERNVRRKSDGLVAPMKFNLEIHALHHYPVPDVAEEK